MELSAEEFEKIKKRADKLVTDNSARNAMWEGFDEIYFMEANNKSSNTGRNKIQEVLTARDGQDVKVTTSPSGRNSVVGMSRLLKTTAPDFKVEDHDEMEKAARKMWEASSRYHKTNVEADASLSAVLYGYVALFVESVDDLLAQDISPNERMVLEDLRYETPVMVKPLNPSQSFPEWGRFGLRAHLWKYKTTGAELNEQYGTEEYKEDEEFTVMDWFDVKRRVVWCEGKTEPMLAEEHGLPFIPISIKLSGGNDLFDRPERQMQPFLYASWKGELHKRENLVYTSLFTSMFERGTGPLAAIDPTSLPGDQLTVNYAGAFRYILGKATLLNDKAFDSDLLQAKGLLDQLQGDSTIYKQTLGENIGGSAPFSSLAMLSQSGRLPLVDPQSAVESAIAEIMTMTFKWMKTDPEMKTEYFNPLEIPAHFKLTCTMTVNLPQDKLRNAQIAAQLKGLVSREWIHTELLQIGDSNKMMEQVWTENTADMIYQAMSQKLVAEIMQPPAPPEPPADTNPAEMPEGPQQQNGAPMMPGQMPGMPGAEAMPMDDPMASRMEGA